MKRSRPRYALLILLVIATGLLWRSGLLPLSSFLSKYGGDALWALMVFLSLGFAFRSGSILWLAVGAVCVAWSVEFSQLYHSPWLDGIRSTHLGRLAIGSAFNAPDLLAYVVGIAIGVLGECIAFHKAQA